MPTAKNSSPSRYKPLREDDASRRPYALSIDWLQCICRRTQYARLGETSPWGVTTVKLDHGSKYWASIYDVFDTDGTLVGQLTADPHKKEVDRAACMFKADNSILYEEYALDRVIAVIHDLGLDYKGISRIDLAYDCNEYYNGLRISSLIDGYLHGRYVKIGQNTPLLWLNMGYYGKRDRDGNFRMFNRQPVKPLTAKQKEAAEREFRERCEECEKAGLPVPGRPAVQALNQAPAFEVGSITWGMRSQSVQVQIYDKSKELREVKMKHHIVDCWRRCGLDLERPVYRTEFRITNRGKMLQNCASGEFFTVSANDILCQEQIEQLFFDYAEKYLCFYHADGHEKVQNSRRVRIFSLCNQRVNRPKAGTMSKDYTRGTCIALHEIDKHIVENDREGNAIAEPLRQVRAYLVDAYNLHDAETRFMQKDLALHGLATDEYKELSPEEYFEQRLQGAPAELAQRAAEARHHVEQFLIARKQEADEDIERRLAAGESMESIVRTMHVDFNDIAKVRGYDTAAYIFPKVAALYPTIKARDFENFRKTLNRDTAAFRKMLEDLPMPDLPQGMTEQFREERRQLAQQLHDSKELTLTFTECPF